MKVLFVSTYEKMSIEIQRLRREFETDFIDVIDLQNMTREEAVSYIEASTCDIVISRGGAYRFIRERISRPVIPIDVTVYDIINMLDFSHIEDILIVGVNEITRFATKLNNLTNIKLNILSLNRHSELRGHVEEIRNYKTVYSDYNSHLFLEEQGIRTRLIESSYESIREAYMRAHTLYAELLELKKQESILDAYLSDENKNVYLYQGRELYIKRITNPLFCREIEQVIDASLDSFLRGGFREKCIYKNEYLIKIYNHHFKSGDARLTAIKVEFVKYPKALADMTWQNEETGNYHMEDGELEELLLYAGSSLPIAVSSCDELLKRKAFHEIINHSEYRDSTPFYIRFNLYTDRELRRLFEDENSILNLMGHVIIFDGPELLSDIYRGLLIDFFLDSRILAANKVILAIRRPETLKELFHSIPYHYVYLSSYFERKDKRDIIMSNLEEFEIPYDDRMVESLEKRGFETEMDLKRALANADTGRLGEATDGENSRGMLEQANLEYVLKILHEENGNRTRAAARLGIGRTTLWRLLKRVEK